MTLDGGDTLDKIWPFRIKQLSYGSPGKKLVKLSREWFHLVMKGTGIIWITFFQP